MQALLASTLQHSHGHLHLRDRRAQLFAVRLQVRHADVGHAALGGALIQLRLQAPHHLKVLVPVLRVALLFHLDCMLHRLQCAPHLRAIVSSRSLLAVQHLRDALDLHLQLMRGHIPRRPLGDERLRQLVQALVHLPDRCVPRRRFPVDQGADLLPLLSFLGLAQVDAPVALILCGLEAGCDPRDLHGELRHPVDDDLPLQVHQLLFPRLDIELSLLDVAQCHSGERGLQRHSAFRERGLQLLVATNYGTGRIGKPQRGLPADLKP
mmetsp:Transcript_53861/g.155532  ORF Transcript_53861/g.155532 Transcript_53861/m.155532 type:complete len:266 (+) Transcript_53861:1306-2103(+)